MHLVTHICVCNCGCKVKMTEFRLSHRTDVKYGRKLEKEVFKKFTICCYLQGCKFNISLLVTAWLTNLTVVCNFRMGITSKHDHLSQQSRPGCFLRSSSLGATYYLSAQDANLEPTVWLKAALMITRHYYHSASVPLHSGSALAIIWNILSRGINAFLHSSSNNTQTKTTVLFN